MVRSALIIASVLFAVTVSFAYAEEVSVDVVPEKVRMATADGDIVFDIPPGKAFTINRYKRAIDSDALTAEIEALVSEVTVTDSNIASLASMIEPLANRGVADTLSTQVDALNDGVENFIHSDELAGLSTLVGAVASTAAAAQSVAENAQETFPDIKNTISTANDLATTVFTERINQARVLREVGTEIQFALSPSTSTNVELAATFMAMKSSAISTAMSYASKVAMVEQALDDVADINEVVDHFGRTHLANNQYAVMRYRQFSTYMQCCGWYYGNRAEFYGGVAPSTWSDGNGIAASMTTNTNVLRNMFTQRVYCGANCAPHHEEWYSYSSTNSRHAAVLIRVRNTTPDAIEWSLSFFYSSYGGWAEQASLAVNGNNIWQTGANCGFCQRSETLSLPGDHTSTIILVVGSSPQSGTRTSHLAFFEDCLVLPDGLEYVDDLDTIEQL